MWRGSGKASGRVSDGKVDRRIRRGVVMDGDEHIGRRVAREVGAGAEGDVGVGVAREEHPRTAGLEQIAGG